MSRRRRYAEGTTVAPEKSRAELETLLRKAGATGFVSGWDDERGIDAITCRIHGRMLRFVIARPDPQDFATTDGGRFRGLKARRAAADAEHRRIWRAQVLIAKAKLEMIGSGLSTIDAEFMAHVLLPDGRTMGETMIPQIEDMYESGVAPTLQLGPGS